MIEIKAPLSIPSDYTKPFLFLGGSIEMGNAEEWQCRFTERVQDTNWTILNPRRDDWNPSWEQTLENSKFREQVEWELSGQEIAHQILMYLSPGTKSPISLLEIGLFARTGKLIVVCPPGFWRKGNVDIVCVRYRVPFFEKIDDAESYLRSLRGWDQKA